MKTKYKEKRFRGATHKLHPKVQILSYFKYAKIQREITMKGMIWFPLHLVVESIIMVSLLFFYL